MKERRVRFQIMAIVFSLGCYSLPVLSFIAMAIMKVSLNDISQMVYLGKSVIFTVIFIVPGLVGFVVCVVLLFSERSLGERILLICISLIGFSEASLFVVLFGAWL